MSDLLAWHVPKGELVHILPHGSNLRTFSHRWTMLSEVPDHWYRCVNGCFDMDGEPNPEALWGQGYFLFQYAHLGDYIGALCGVKP